MAKTIKFNLILDNNPIRDIKGLQENFCIDDILEVYNQGLLEKWLKVRGFDEYLKRVDDIDMSKSIIIQLIQIFGIEDDKDKIDEGIAPFELIQEKKKKKEKRTLESGKDELERFKILSDKLEEMVNTYHHKHKEDLKLVIRNFLEENMGEVLKMMEIYREEIHQRNRVNSSVPMQWLIN